MTEPARLSPRTLAVVVGIPGLIAVAALAVSATWMPDLPADVAVHWRSGGAPDGFAPAWWAPVLLLATLAIVDGVLVLAMAGTARPEGLTAVQKLLGSMSVGIAALFGVILVGSLAIQRGLDDASAAGSIAPVLAVAVAVALVSGAGAWFLLPRSVSARPAPSTPAAPLPVEAGERVAWFGTVSVAPAVAVAIVVAFAAATAAAVLGVVVTEGELTTLLAVPVVLGLLALTTLRWSVRVDHRGLVVQGTVGLPVFRIPLGSIRSVSATEVDALGEFGGVGIRLGFDGRYGVVLRRGPALEVTRTNGGVFVVTVDGAAEAASTIAAHLAGRPATGD